MKGADIPKPGQAGWKPAPPRKADGQSLTASALGQKMDQATSQLTNALVDAENRMEVNGAQLSGHTVLKVQDGKTFNVEFITPATEGRINRLISNGEDKTVYYDGKWTKEPVAATGSKGAVSSAVVDRFALDFPRSMFAPFETGQRVWGPVLAELSDAKRFKTSIEEKVVKVNGKSRPIYRVLAERHSDGTEIEVVVDGARYLPLTVRSLVKGKKGVDRRMWTGRWSFGGRHSARDFEFPGSKRASSGASNP